MIIAYHAIFTTYGTWLPNDPCGSFSEKEYKNEPVDGDQCRDAELPCTPEPCRGLQLRRDGDLSGGFMLRNLSESDRERLFLQIRK